MNILIWILILDDHPAPGLFMDTGPNQMPSYPDGSPVEENAVKCDQTFIAAVSRGLVVVSICYFQR